MSDNVNDNQEIIETNTNNSGQQNETANSTQGGLDDNIAGLLCYLFGIITGVIFLFVKPESKFVRFHAWQSIMVTALIGLLGIIIAIIDFILAYIPIIGWLFGLLLTMVYTLGIFVLWIILMVTAYQGKELNIPIAGQIARNLTEKQ